MSSDNKPTPEQIRAALTLQLEVVKVEPRTFRPACPPLALEELAFRCVRRADVLS